MFELPKLEYAYDALEPFIDEATMAIHHSKHHQAYVDNLNKAVAGTKFEAMPIEEILKNMEAVPESIRNAVRNHGGGHYNHALFWKMMKPGGGKPCGELAEAINEKFGNLEKLQEQFSAAAIGRFGSGWAWLSLNKNELEISSTANQDSPVSEGKKIILGIDVWEHAYYLRYMNKRAEYVKNWWNVTNWSYAETVFNQARE